MTRSGVKDIQTLSRERVAAIEQRSRDILDRDARLFERVMSNSRARASNLLAGSPRLDLKTVRTIHHLACTGGTIIAKAIQAQYNVRVLSEVEPFSRIGIDRSRKRFSPSDLIYLARSSLFGISDEAIADMFRQAFDAIQLHMSLQGQKIVLRDHAHSRFCTDLDPTSVPGVRALLGIDYHTISIVSVRHPLDSFLGAVRNGWLASHGDMLGEYCRRYHLFLNENAGLPIIKYENFVARPNTTMEEICDHLDLRLCSEWQEFLPAIVLSGDSGRSGHEIAPRPRRPVSDALASEVDSSLDYQTLLERLGYE